jgi:hypothetical protein
LPSSEYKPKVISLIHNNIIKWVILIGIVVPGIDSVNMAAEGSVVVIAEAEAGGMVAEGSGPKCIKRFVMTVIAIVRFLSGLPETDLFYVVIVLIRQKAAAAGMIGVITVEASEMKRLHPQRMRMP